MGFIDTTLTPKPSVFQISMYVRCGLVSFMLDRLWGKCERYPDTTAAMALPAILRYTVFWNSDSGTRSSK